MTNIDEMIAVLQAAKAGKAIEFRHKGDLNWRKFQDWSVFDFIGRDYRVKPDEPREWTVTVGQSALYFGHLPSQQNYPPVIKVREVL